MNYKYVFIIFSLMNAALSLKAVEIIKITPSVDIEGNIQHEIHFEGRMIAPPHFVNYQNEVAIKWPNASTSKNTTSDDFDLKQIEDALLLVYKNVDLKPSDISKLSLKLTGNIVKTYLPQIHAPVISPKNKKSESVPVQGIQVIEKKTPEIVKKKDTKNNEDYLSYLLSSVDKESSKNSIKKETENVTENVLNSHSNLQANSQVKSQLKPEAKIEVKETKNFSSYMIRIMMVLTLLVGVILLLAKVSKKIMVGKNKLGFLNNSKIVEILNTTYIAPKRQLLLVKVHDQVMLLANSENGLSFISEINDLSNILKNAESEVVGNNFDTNLDKNPVSEVQLKDSARMYESTPVVTKSSKMRSVLTNKAKSLKAWQ